MWNQTVRYLNSPVHFHVLVTDGVFSDDGDGGAGKTRLGLEFRSER
jgi:hypothetical protein